jgi:cytoskeletal protein RodZ
MKAILAAIAAAAAIGLTACATAENNGAPATTTPAPSTPAPTVTVTQPPSQSKAPAVTPAQASTSAPAANPAPGSTTTAPSVTDPWAVVSAYYGDVESGNYREAWALLSYGMVTGQSYQQFVDGYACTGNQQLTDLGESGDQVRFNLTATDNCTGAVQHFTGVDTVIDGKIVAAHVTQTG